MYMYNVKVHAHHIVQDKYICTFTILLDVPPTLINNFTTQITSLPEA